VVCFFSLKNTDSSPFEEKAGKLFLVQKLVLKKTQNKKKFFSFFSFSFYLFRIIIGFVSVHIKCAEKKLFWRNIGTRNLAFTEIIQLGIVLIFTSQIEYTSMHM
jgi:hypothetical protein